MTVHLKCERFIGEYKRHGSFSGLVRVPYRQARQTPRSRDLGNGDITIHPYVFAH